MSSSELARESVWDYPRPPRIEPCTRRVRIEHGGEVVAESDRALRVLETASPPTIYTPRDDIRTELLNEVEAKHSYCEWKGQASYCNVEAGGSLAEAAAFFYPDPRSAFEAIRDHVSFYPGRVDAAFLGDERVRPQAGSFYAGWITAEIEGPFKGDPGTEGW